jgi:hypothetical protein
MIITMISDFEKMNMSANNMDSRKILNMAR